MYHKILLISILLIIGLISCNKNYQQMDYHYIKLNEGKEIEITGKLKPPKIDGVFPHDLLILSDKTQLIIGLTDVIDKDEVLNRKNKGKIIKIIGKVYTDNIPDEYQIIGRDSRPYILSIKSIELLK